MATKKAAKKSTKGRAWKLERASVHTKKTARPRTNKYSAGDSDTKPPRGKRGQFWVGGYTREDGTKVAGHYRKAS
jgi:hypothetical protein